MIGIASVVPQFASQAGSPATAASSATAAVEGTQVFSANLLAFGTNATRDLSKTSNHEAAASATEAAKQQTAAPSGNSSSSLPAPTTQSATSLSNLLDSSGATPEQSSNTSVLSPPSVLPKAETSSAQVGVTANAVQTRTMLPLGFTKSTNAQARSGMNSEVVVPPVAGTDIAAEGSHPAEPAVQPAAQLAASCDSQPQPVKESPVNVPIRAVVAPPAIMPVPQSTSTQAAVSVTANSDKSSMSSESEVGKKQLKATAPGVAATQPVIHTVLPSITVPALQPVTLQQQPTVVLASPPKTVNPSAKVSVVSSAAQAGQASAALAPQLQVASDTLHPNVSPKTVASSPTTAHANDTHGFSSLIDHATTNTSSTTSANAPNGDATNSNQSSSAASGWSAATIAAAVSGIHSGGLTPVATAAMQPQASFAIHSGPGQQPVAAAAHSSSGESAAAHATGETYSAPQTTLRATPNSLEVGLSGGSQGWLKVRAEVHGENVSATLSSTSTSGTRLLHEQLPALNAFLNTQNISVATTVTPRLVVNAEAHSAMANLAHEGNQQGNSSQSQAQRQFHDTPESAGANGILSSLDSHLGTLPLAQPALLAGSGSWLNVLA